MTGRAVSQAPAADAVGQWPGLRRYHIAALAPEIRRSGQPVIIFGAGDLGKLAHAALALRGIAVHRFCDGRSAKHSTACRGVPVLAPADLAGLPRDAYVFVAANYLAPITSLLSGLGFRDIYDCADLLTSTDFSRSDVGMQPVFIERKVALHRRECEKAREGAAGALILKYVDVVVTEACSMKCQDCSNLMQYYRKPRHADMDLLMQALGTLMASIDGLYEFRVLGGEPFVNRHVHQVIEKLLSYQAVGKVVVYTNATILPAGPNLDILRDKRVVLDITNYGELSRKHDEMTALLRREGINYLTKRPIWTDSGRIKFVDRPAEVLDDMFRNCCVNDVLTLLHGILYRCPFSANGTNLHAIPQNPADMVPLAGETVSADPRGDIGRLYGKKTHLEACKYCNGRDFRTPKIEPAIQVRRPLPLV